jgi:hypothetical protein
VQYLKKSNNYFIFHKDHSALSSTTSKNKQKKFYQGKFKKKKNSSLQFKYIFYPSKYSNQEIDFLDIDVEGADFKVSKD